MALKPGDIITLPESAYKYGRGQVTLRVTKVRRELLAAYEGKWIWLNGHERNWDGTESREERSFLVEVASLPDGAV